MAQDKVVPNPQEVITKDLPRQTYDLSHFSMQVGAIGCLQTLSCIPVIAGDSFSVDVHGVFRLSPLRRNLYLDCKLDLYAFYVPHRHIYGADWVTFLKAGYDEATTLGTDTVSATGLQCVGVNAPDPGATVPRWLMRGYMQIYKRYFIDPSDATAGALADNYLTTVTSDEVIYGLGACHIKRIWNTGVLVTTTTADYRYPLSGGEVSLLDMSALQGRLKSEQARDYFSIRYKDLLEYQWSVKNLNIDADQRPELIMHTSNWLSGMDINGTDNATLGSYSGKSTGIGQLRIPTKFFPEHGALWIMALLRFPPVHRREMHYLVGKPEPTYAQISGDPSVIGRTAPVDMLASDVFYTGGAVSLGSIPYGQWYRENPHVAHPRYTVVAGHPFLDTVPASRVGAIYHTTTTYDSVFGTLQLKHWNAQCHIGIEAKRFVPDPKQSIFAGVGGGGVS